MVNATHCHELGRAANVARVEVGMPLDPDPLPPFARCNTGRNGSHRIRTEWHRIH